MFIRIPYYDAKKINIMASKSCKNKYSDPNNIGNNLTEKICQCCFHFNSPGKWPVWAFAITWCLSSVCFFTFHTSNFFLRNTEQETKLAVMFPMSSCTSILSLVLIRHKHWRHRTLKCLIGQSFKNAFSRTEEGIGMKLGTNVPIKVVSKCWDLSVDTKFKMATIGGERLHIIFMGNAFSPSSFWEPLYIIHPNLTAMISGAPLVTNCLET
jgi:hypothetical protein